MNTFSTYQDAADSIAQAIGAGDAHPSEYDMAAIETALIQRFQPERSSVLFYVAAAPIAAADYDELTHTLEDDAYDIADAFWAVIESHAL